MILDEQMPHLLDDGVVRDAPEDDQANELDQDSATDEALSDGPEASWELSEGWTKRRAEGG